MTKSPVETHFDEVAKDYDFYKSKSGFYYSNLKALLKDLIPEGKRVLEIGCGTGELLVALNPEKGYGFDISTEMIRLAKVKNPSNDNVKFSTTWPRDRFDYIFMSDVIEHLEYPKVTFRKIAGLMNSKTVFINTMMNPLWWPIERIYSWLGWKMPEGPHSRIWYHGFRKMIEKSGMKIIKHDYKLLMPINIPIVTKFANRYLERYLKMIAFIEYFVVIMSRK